MKLFKQSFGTVILIEVSGTPHEIELQHNSWYNFCATEADNLIFLSDKFAHTWTTPKKFEKYLYLSSYYEISAREKIYTDSEYLRNEAKKLAKEKEKRYIEETILRYSDKKILNTNTYKVHEPT